MPQAQSTPTLLPAPPDPADVRITNKWSGAGRFPKGVKENLAWRREILRRGKRDEGFRAAVRELYDRDVLFAFNAFFWTLDVRKRPMAHQPFCTYPYEDELILDLVGAIDGKEDRVYEKSRDMGATWCLLGTFFWYWARREGGVDFLVGSRIEDYVDKKGDPRTHFSRLRYLRDRHPRWLWPKGYRKREHDTHMKLVNPQTGATITGESNNANFSTQGRYSAIFYDEFAKWEVTDESAWTAGGDASPCRIAVSTPFGAGGQFFKLVTEGRVKKKTFHWSRHPEKGQGLSCLWPPPNDGDRESLGERWRPKVVLRSPWYDKECSRRTKTEVAQELDIDYLGSGNPIFEGAAWETLMYLNQLALDPVEAREPMLGRQQATKVDLKSVGDAEGLLLIYGEAKEGRGYALGVDVVEGVEGGDYSVIHVLDRLTKDVVASYFSRVDEVQLGGVVKLVARLYEVGEEAPWVGVETPGPGLATFDVCVALGVPNLFMSPRYDVTNQGVSYKKGWRNDVNSRPELIAGIKEWLIERQGAAHQRLVGEMMTFVRSKTGKPQAKAGCHDDEVMAFGIALQVDELAPAVEGKKGAGEGAFETRAVTAIDEAERVEEPTLEEACAMQAMEKRKPMKEEVFFWGDEIYHG